MENLNVGVVGVGHLGSMHARVYSKMKNVNLVGICDINKARVQQIAKKFRTNAHTGYRALFTGLDAVSIAVPTYQHYKIAKDFLKNGIHVLIEKPIAKTVEEADELVRIARENNLILQVGHIERFNAAVIATEKLLSEPRFIECHRLGPFTKRGIDVGVILDLMIHDIDIILGLVKSEVEQIDAVGINVLSKYEDIANVRLTFKNGCVCNLTASRITRGVTRKIRIFQEDAYISLNYAGQAAVLYRKWDSRITKQKISIKKEEPLKKELESFVECLRTKIKPVVTGEEAREALKIAVAITSQINSKLKSQKRTPKVLIVAGEPSGDLHGSSLAKSLREANPELKLFGIGGLKMEESGVEITENLSDLAVVGVVEIIRYLKKIKNIFKSLVSEAERRRPDLAVLIDYPGFNLRLAKELKKRNIPVIYYISPQVWAWGKHRIHTIKKLVSQMLVLFKFEEDLYRSKKVNVRFVGHPLLDVVNPTLSKEEALRSFGLRSQAPIISLLPGSRENVIRTLIPIMLGAAKRIQAKIPSTQFLLLKAANIPGELYENLLKNSALKVRLIEERPYDCIRAADLVVVASGTATLETALIGTPMVIIYKISTLSYILSRFAVKIPFIGLVNVIRGKKVVPELIQYKARPKLIAKEALNILSNPARVDQMKKEFDWVRKSLGDRGASTRAARIIVDSLNRND